MFLLVMLPGSERKIAKAFVFGESVPGGGGGFDTVKNFVSFSSKVN